MTTENHPRNEVMVTDGRRRVRNFYRSIHFAKIIRSAVMLLSLLLSIISFRIAVMMCCFGIVEIGNRFAKLATIATSND